MLAEVIRKVVDEVNKLPIQNPPPQPITFVAGGTVTAKQKSRKYAGLLQSTRDWILKVDVDTVLHLPAEVAVTSLRPNTVVWLKATKTVILCKLKVPWEDHVEETYERKKEKYQVLTDTCKERGYQS